MSTLAVDRASSIGHAQQVKVKDGLRIVALGVGVVVFGSFAAYIAANAIMWAVFTWFGR